MKSKALWFAGILMVVAFTGGFYLSGCGSSKPSVTCCDTASLGYCVCYEGQTCESSEKMVNACPTYGNCCRDQSMSDFCTCWDLTCSKTTGASSQVGSCP